MFQKVDYGFELMSEKILQWLSHNVELTKEQLMIRRFAIQSILNEAIKLIVLAILFGVMHNLALYICSVVTLASTRCFMGGTHRKTILGCFLQSLLTFMVLIELSKRVYIYPYHSIVYLLALVVIWKSSPVCAERRIHYGTASKMKFRAKAISAVLCITCIAEMMPCQLQNCMIWTLLYQSIETFFVYTIKEKQEGGKRNNDR